MEHIIVSCTLEQALDDGILHLVGRKGQQPLVVTQGVMEDLGPVEIRQAFGEFLIWQLEIEPGLVEEERLFSRSASNGKRVWVIDDGAAITMLYPEEY